METVADTIGDGADEKPQRIEAPRHAGQPAFPTPGIYLGMPEDEYHSIHACSASGLKSLSVSSMDYWANSPLNLERKEKAAATDGKLSPMELGRAYHTFICEGAAAFNERYAVALNKDDERGICEQKGIPFCVTISDIRAAIDAAGGVPKGTSKEVLGDLLLEFEPNAVIWDRAVANHEKENAGKVMISDVLYRRILIANKMIVDDPQLKDAFVDGHAEVSIFWYDEQTGIPCKARLDYLKMNHLLDLKSFSNKQRKPIQRAIDMAISYEKYFLAVAFYLEAIAAAKALVKANVEKAVFLRDPYQKIAVSVGREHPIVKWFWTWAHQPEPDCLWIFQQTGIAPVTRGRIMHSGSTLEVNRMAMRMLMRKWRKCAETYDVDPWLDIEPVRTTVDEELTWSATDFGDINYGD